MPSLTASPLLERTYVVLY